MAEVRRGERRAAGQRASAVLRVSKKNSLFQEWLALKTNRQKRHRTGQFLVEGTTNIDRAIEHGWQLEALLHPAGRRLSAWAEQHLASQVAQSNVEIDAELLAELSERNEGTELLAVARSRDVELASLVLPEPWLVVVVDRSKSPGNLGSIIRTAVSFDAAAVVLTGHAADPFDPACVRASVGTLFDVPLVRLPSQGPLLSWLEQRRAVQPITSVGTGQDGTELIDRVDLTGNTLIILGNETEGLSRAYRDACDRFVRLPTSARQSSLNVSAAAAIVLYEVQRQRGRLEPAPSHARAAPTND
ncbi:MAG TPA: TrmH family RNA methyltransferase [Polyangiaceae bacterium]|nr:TrmH family RNA methyltransferase [Polyangiaceae bacterium]